MLLCAYECVYESAGVMQADLLEENETIEYVQPNLSVVSVVSPQPQLQPLPHSQPRSTSSQSIKGKHSQVHVHVPGQRLPSSCPRM